jgi:hypothetical protein
MGDATTSPAWSESEAPEPSSRQDGGHPASPRYRPGRGGYDADAASRAARARSVFRQRMVLTLALLAVATGLVAGGLGLAEGWYAHAGVDLFVVCYLIYLRRQVRVEQSIRARRAARMARRGHPGETGHELDDRSGDRAADGGRARRGRGRRRPTVADAVAARQAQEAARSGESGAGEDLEYDESVDYESDYETADYQEADCEPAGDPVRREASPTGHGELINDEPALPRLQPAAPPERPRGTVVVELDDEDPELHDLDTRLHRGYRHAAGQ